MVCSARIGAGVVTAAVLYALGAPFGANVEGEGLGVLCDVGGDAVVADAGIGKCFPIALILACGGGVDAGQLSADEGALSLLVVTPGLPSEIRDGVGIDGVRVVLLGLVLGDGKACDGEDAEGEYRVHIVCLKLGDVLLGCEGCRY